MCGIALILSGASIVRPDFVEEQSLNTLPNDEHETSFVPDLNAVLLRRGPDCLGEKKVLVNLRCTPFIPISDELSHSCSKIDNCTGSSFHHHQNVILNSNTKSDDEKIPEKGGLLLEKGENNIKSVREIAFPRHVTSNRLDFSMELHFIGATLHLRGLNPVRQPLVDSSGNILIYNGEIYGGIHVDADKNDGEALLHTLGKFHSCECFSQQQQCYCISKGEMHICHVLSTIRGPWALIYWQARSRTLWFGRDAFGRRSLLVHWPNVNEPQFVLSSVSSQSKIKHSDEIFHLDELPCGIYSIFLGGLKYNPHDTTKNIHGIVKEHGWSDSLLKELVQWKRSYVDPNSGSKYHVLTMKEATRSLQDARDTLPTHKVLTAMRKSVMRRTVSSTIFQNTGKGDSAPVAILFSGGLDSMLLATLLDECLNSTYTIDLLNVSFDGVSAPDRISALSGLKELQRISSSRRWRLVEIDAKLSNLTSEIEHVKSLIYPSETYMDLNIGIALWLAANGEGVVDGHSSNYHESGCCQYKYKSDARILLVGSGADEQCAGYGRHRTKYKAHGWAALDEEMKLDMHRIWKRNLGRDDRCISDHGKEARFPFLDEDVIKCLLEIPLWEIANLDEPSGRGDKKILREVAKLLGLDGAAFLPKRAIQFGSRIARESNKHNFGSNRAANQASAGSVVIGAGACV